MIFSSTRTAPRATLGTPYKLVSKAGTLLGILTVPDRIADLLQQHDTAQFCLDYPLPGPYLPVTEMAGPYRLGCIRRCWNWHESDAVELIAVTPEEIERVRGWSFAPSAAYLRTLLD